MSTLCDVTVPMVTVPRTNWVISSAATCMVADGGERGPRVGQHRFACRGQPHRATRPIHKGLAQLAFQTLDLCADRGLGDVDPLGRPGEVGLLGDGDEILQLSKFHKQ